MSICCAFSVASFAHVNKHEVVELGLWIKSQPRNAFHGSWKAEMFWITGLMLDKAMIQNLKSART